MPGRRKLDHKQVQAQQASKRKQHPQERGQWKVVTEAAAILSDLYSVLASESGGQISPRIVIHIVFQRPNRLPESIFRRNRLLDRAASRTVSGLSD